jgi:hypothetical protein
MTNRIQKAFGVLAFAGTLALTPAYATDIDFTTTGTFSNCGGGYTCLGGSLSGPNSLSIIFTPQNTANVGPYSAPPPTNDSYGFFTVVTDGPLPDTLSATFTLDVLQTSPLIASENVDGSVNGTISFSNSKAVLTFGVSDPSTQTLSIDPTTIGSDPGDNVPAISFVLGTETYWVDTIVQINKTAVGPSNPTDPIVGAVTGPGGTTGGSGTPEPSFYALTGVGLIGLIATALRRKKQTLA